MKTVLDLLKPRLWPLLHRRPAGSTRQYVRLAVVTTVAGALWIGVFMVSLRVLTHFSTIEQIGALLNYKLLNMLMVTALALLVFSDILGDCLYRWRPEVGETVLRGPSNMANGNTFDRQGRLLTCEHATSRVTRTDFARDG